jgi:beta-galactosidase/beta-glucuronidase
VTKVFIQQKPNFDFFNYAGILRSVQVQALGPIYVQELQIRIEKPSEFFAPPHSFKTQHFALKIKKSNKKTHLFKFFSISDNLNYALQLSRPNFQIDPSQLKVLLCLFDENQQKVECVQQSEHFRPVKDVRLWWPRGMGRQSLYTLEVGLSIYFR